MPPTASSCPSGLNASAWNGPTVAPIGRAGRFPEDPGRSGAACRVAKNATLAVVAAHSQDTAVRAKRLVEDATASGATRERGRAAQQRREQVAPRRERVVEVDALAREQERAVERGSDSACAPSRCAIAAVACRFARTACRERERHRRARRQREQDERGGEQRAQRAGWRAAAAPSARAVRLSSRNSRSTRFSAGAARPRVRPFERAASRAPR